MLWILVPLWLSWFFGEFFQEKIGTSFGNAISNAVVVIWAGIDCIRQTAGFIEDRLLVSTGDIVIRFLLCGLLIAYGIVIIIYGTKVKEKVKIFGRIRDVTYAFAILVPVLYNVVPFTPDLVIAAVMFFPLFYYAIELVDVKTPTPKAVEADLEKSEKELTKNVVIEAKTDATTNKIVNNTSTNKIINNSTNNKNIYSYDIYNKNNKKPPNSGNMSYWSNG
jgi:hypothetical protein